MCQRAVFECFVCGQRTTVNILRCQRFPIQPLPTLCPLQFHCLNCRLFIPVTPYSIIHGCIDNPQTRIAPPLPPPHWSPADTLSLCRAVLAVGKSNWTVVAQIVSGEKTAEQCRKRYAQFGSVALDGSVTLEGQVLGPPPNPPAPRHLSPLRLPSPVIAPPKGAGKANRRGKRA
ncbi:hypothetical protein B0T22DRAFT_284277 [Podospora appendiculata]|uniref:Myb-like domain-containing protein n=1 Tax=Podospora appendiculata TaxID=314037 RepID=A0AAE0X0Z5_9PEZI|nr:hypothetical protein B0T22DRAFT_284277 [Podospora appendiculata]